jgi:hypothetical protein
MSRIIGSAGAAHKYTVIARTLAFKTQLMSGKPHERIEPVGGARKLSKALYAQVVAFYVREFMQQNRSNAGPRPLGGSLRHYDDRTP